MVKDRAARPADSKAGSSAKPQIASEDAVVARIRNLVPTLVPLLSRREILSGLPLACDRFEFCPEVTARLVRRGIPILEVPIGYKPRSMTEGKKIRWHDGLRAAWTMLSLRWAPSGPGPLR